MFVGLFFQPTRSDTQYCVLFPILFLLGFAQQHQGMVVHLAAVKLEC